MAASDEDLSPKNRLKFLCSFGGRFLPRPSDGLLKYVGGETRALTVPRSISFSELMEKINGMFNSEVVIKYQLLPEDLDALVSVRNQEDLQYMIEEYDRHDSVPRSPTSTTSPRFRLFLFSTTVSTGNTAPTSPVAPRRSVEGVNAGAGARPLFMLSADTSPTNTIDAGSVSHAALLLGGRGAAGGRPAGGMHRVRSTPNLGGSQQSQMSNGVPGSPRGYNRHHPHHHHQCAGYGVPGPTWRGMMPMVIPSQQPQVMMPRYWYPQAVPGHGGGGGYWGHGGNDGGGGAFWGHGGNDGGGGGFWGHGGGNDGGGPRSGHGSYSSGAPSPRNQG